MSSTETVVKAKLRVRVDKAGYTGRMLAVLFHANQTMITEHGSYQWLGRILHWYHCSNLGKIHQATSNTTL